MKYLYLLVVTLVLSVILHFMGAEKWEMKVTGGFFIINIILIVLGYIKANELMGIYLSK